MLKRFFPLLFLAGFFFLFFLPSVEAQETPIYVSKIEGEIKAGTVQYLGRAINTAQENEAEYLIIKLDTPGGLIESTKRITNLIEESEVEIVVFVYRRGGWAYSAGSFILLAADYAFMHPDSSTGAAEPRAITGETTEEDEKTQAAMVSWIRGLAEGNNRDPDIAEKFVTENLTLTGTEGLKLGMVDGTARSLDEVLQSLEVDDPGIVRVDPNFFENVFNFLSHPYLVSLFLSLGFLALVFAFRTGEFELSGILGLILLFIGLWGMGIISFSVLGVVFLALGILLLGVEVFGEPGFGVVGIMGVVSLAFGIFNFSAEPLLAPKIFDFITLFTLGVLLSFLVLFVIIGKSISNIYRKPPVTGSESLIGKKGEVIKDISPVGKVKIEREVWSAKTADGEKISAGSFAEIIKTEGNTLIVKKVEVKI